MRKLWAAAVLALAATAGAAGAKAGDEGDLNATLVIRVNTRTPRNCHVIFSEGTAVVAGSFCAAGRGWHRVEMRCSNRIRIFKGEWTRAGGTSIEACPGGTHVTNVRTGKASRFIIH